MKNQFAIKNHLNRSFLQLVPIFHAAALSKCTEEFYAKNNERVLVVVEDDGEGTKGKPKDQLDKLYYFNKGKVITELTSRQEKEYTIKQSDAEELAAEFNEYLEIFANLGK